MIHTSFSVEGTKFHYDLDWGNSLEIQSLNKNYSVAYTSDSLKEIISKLYKPRDFILVDQNVFMLDPPAFHEAGDKVMVLEATEENKTMEYVLAVVDSLLEIKFSRENRLIVIGGGITQEVGGFAAAIYKRGIDWILVPTTILSMTDSCIGSKVSINHNKTKNMLGMFVAPNEIVISDWFLKSLKDDDIVSGVGEALKLSMIGGPQALEAFMGFYSTKDYMSIIKLASLVKKQVIERDEFEKHERKVLNYGHTVGHSLEATSNYEIPHGIGVLMGMYIKNVLFQEEYEYDFSDLNRFIKEMIPEKFFRRCIDFETFKKHILLDKKNRGNEICFIVLEKPGVSRILYKNLSTVETPLRKIMEDLFISS
jgi:3-dehydroquinate synthase